MRIRLGKLEWRIWEPRVLKALLKPRPKAKPPVNYNPNGLWRDYFDLSQRNKKDKP